MRLGQLSRQLEISPDKIVKVLADNFREVNNHPNIKITEEELAFLVVHFTPATPKAEPVAEKESVAEPLAEINDAPETEEKELVKEDAIAPAYVEALRPQVITLEEEFNAQKENLEAYKAEKVELEGLKVVGKIELPEPPVKKEKPKKEQKEESDEIKHLNRRPRNGRQSGNRKPMLSPVEYQKKKEERLAKRKKEAEEKRLKELKKKHYETQVKSKLQQPKKKKKTANPQTVVTPESKSNTTQKSKSNNPVKRFWLWLNGAYDK